MAEPLVHYSVFDIDRVLTKSYKIPITSIRMIHDFVITQNYLVVPDLPVEFDPERAIKEKKGVFQFNK